VNRFLRIPIAVGNRYFTLTRFSAYVAAFFLFILMIYICADVAGRYLANSPMPASYELATTMMVFIVFLAFAYAQARKMHIRLAFVRDQASPRLQAILDILAYLIGFALFALITWKAWEWAWEAWLSKDYMQGVLKIPYFPSRFAVVIGALLFCFQFALDVIRHIGQLWGSSRVREEG